MNPPYSLEPYKAQQIERLKQGPIPFEPDELLPPAMTGIDLPREALMTLIMDGVAEVDPDLCVIRLHQTKPSIVVDSPYPVTPAMEALRARRLAMGR